MRESENSRRPANWLQILALIAAMLVGCATSRLPYMRYPGWQITSEREHHIGPLTMRAWVSKSGHRGVGLTLKLHNSGDHTESVTLRRALLTVRGETRIPSKGAPKQIRLGPDEMTHVYLPFVFDNRGSWQRNAREGALHIELTIGTSGVHGWTLALSHVGRKYLWHTKKSTLVDTDTSAPTSDSAASIADAGLSVADSEAQ